MTEMTASKSAVAAPEVEGFDKVREASAVPSKESLGLYLALSKWRWPRTYRGKIMLVAFLGTHIPLLTLLVASVLHSDFAPHAKAQVLLVSLAATLIGTAGTLFLLNHLLAPMMATASALRAYLSHKTRPQLPTHFGDEAGLLMADTMRALGQLDEVIHFLRDYDALTGLPNREQFQAKISDAIARNERQNGSFAVFLVDVDHFAHVNTLGQEAGDALLREVAERLKACLSPESVLARVGADQFAILHFHAAAREGATSPAAVATDSLSPEFLLTLGRCFLEEVSRPYTLGETPWRATACVGIALYADNGEPDSARLLENADAALHSAKAQGPGSTQFFAAANSLQLLNRLSLGMEMHGALERGEFVLHYQPQIDGATEQISGFEALVRWQHPTRGLVPPGDFIPIAEANGLIVPLGDWVLKTACAQFKAWADAGLGTGHIAVNLSARQFAQHDLVSKVAAILQETGLEARFLELEVTESMVMGDVESAVQTLQKLHDLGIELSLDDFGTGYSSLAYLKRFPLNALKIDRSFVRDLLEDDNDKAITASIIALAKTLGLSVIAEGVETSQQSRYLQEHGCHKLQGFLFSRPLDAAKCEAFLREKSAALG